MIPRNARECKLVSMSCMRVGTHSNESRWSVMRIAPSAIETRHRWIQKGLRMKRCEHDKIVEMFHKADWYEKNKDKLEKLYESAKKKEKDVRLYSTIQSASVAFFEMMNESPYRTLIWLSIGDLMIEKLERLNSEIVEKLESISIDEIK